MASERRHIVAVTIPAFGHIIPLVDLLRKLLDRSNNVCVTFVTSACKRHEVLQREVFSMRHTNRVRIFPLEDGLPQNIDTNPTARHLADIKAAMDGPLTALLDEMSRVGGLHRTSPMEYAFEEPVWAVVSDFYVGTCGEICRRRRVPWYCFVTSAAFTIRGMHEMPKENQPADDDIFFRPPTDVVGPPPMPPITFKFMTHCKESSLLAKEILVNSFQELEVGSAEYFGVSAELGGKPVRFICPLVPEKMETDKSSKTKFIIDWLDRKPDRSVIYVSFGSMVRPEAEQLQAVGAALISLRRPFVWSLRSSEYTKLPSNMQKKIVGQVDATDSPFFVLPWVPQQQVLSHSAVKVFVSHCGWNGTLETVFYGKPVVGWPMFADQHPNADLLAQNEMAIKIPGTGLKNARLVSATELREVIEKVGGWNRQKETDQYYQTAQQWGKKARSAIQPGGSSDGQLQLFMESCIT